MHECMKEPAQLEPCLLAPPLLEPCLLAPPLLEPCPWMELAQLEPCLLEPPQLAPCPWKVPTSHKENNIDRSMHEASARDQT